MLVMIVSSLYARKLVFMPDMRRVGQAIVRHPRIGNFLARVVSWWSKMRGPSAPASDGESTGRSSSFSASRRSLSRHLFHREGLLGVDSPYFDHILILREIVETGLQIYQLYRMTLLLPRLWLIRFYVVLLIGNCWPVAILHRLYRRSETKRRMLCLLCDALLDMMSSIGVAIILFATYIQQYDVNSGFGFPFVSWFDDKWLSNMQHEFQMLAVASWADMGSRLVFALGLLQCMDAIKELLTPPPSPSAAQSLKVQSPATAPANATRLDSGAIAKLQPPTNGGANTASVVRPSEITTQHQDKSSPSADDAPAKPAPRSRAATMQHYINALGPVLFAAWGCAILVVHIVAESHVSDVACDLRLQPWLSAKPGCALVELDCHALQSTGSDGGLAASWQVFDPERAARVVLRHCPSLAIAELQDFRNIKGLKVYNSTIVAWGLDGAVTASNHASLRGISLIRTDLPNGELPPALLSSDFPPLLKTFLVCVSNLKSLPDNLDSLWSRRMGLAFEYSQLTGVPDVALRLKPSMLSVAGSKKVTQVPAKVFEIVPLRVVILSNTAIQELPADVTHPNPNLFVLFIQGTNVSTLWPWMDDYLERTAVAMRLKASGTKLCKELDEIVAQNRSAFSVGSGAGYAKAMDVSTPEKLRFTRAAVDCAKQPWLETHFPLGYEDGVHALRG